VNRACSPNLAKALNRRAVRGGLRCAPRSVNLKALGGKPPVAPKIMASAFSLLEIILVLGIFAILSAMIMPTFIRELQGAKMPESCRRLRGLLQLTRGNAMLEGRRYRIRFPSEDELDGDGTQYQPVIEVERKPLEEPEIFTPVLASWARDPIFDEGVRCARVRLGRPTIEMMMGEVLDEEKETEDDMAERIGDVFAEGHAPLVFEPDGTSEWATFVITNAPADVDYEDLDPEEDNIIDVILDGLTGLSWLQRRLYEDELTMMQEHGWPPVMRKDFLDPVALTEDDVLEIREQRIRQ